MLKKIALCALILLPLGAFAQEKIAYFNPLEIYVIMPEFKQMQDSLQKEEAAVRAELQILEEEYAKKTEAFMREGEGLIETIRVRRLQEIQEIEQRANIFHRDQQERLAQLQESLVEPIQKKVKDAIKAVGAANNFLYILNGNPEILLYVSPNAIDATPLVQQYLKL